MVFMAQVNVQMSQENKDGSKQVMYFYRAACASPATAIEKNENAHAHLLTQVKGLERRVSFSTSYTRSLIPWCVL